GNGSDVGGGVRTVRPVITGDPASGDRNAVPNQPGSWLNVPAFARPSGRGDYGNAARNLFQLPGIDNWNLAVFKNVAAGGSRRLQFRWEVYNLLNHTQFSAGDNTARFHPTRANGKGRFWKATTRRHPRH